MDINAVNDDPTELAKKYCEEHDLDYAEQGTHVEVEIQKDMLHVCRVKIEDLMKQRETMKDKIVSLSNSSLSVRLKQAVEMLKGEETHKIELTAAYKKAGSEKEDLEQKLIAKTAEFESCSDDSASKLEGLREIHQQELEKHSNNSRVQVKQLCAAHAETLQDLEQKHQQLLLTATSKAMEKVNQFEREIKEEKAAMKVLTLSTEETVSAMEKSHTAEVEALNNKVNSLQRIVDQNNKTLKKRNAKLKGAKDELSKRSEDFLNKEAALNALVNEALGAKQALVDGHREEVNNLNDQLKRKDLEYRKSIEEMDCKHKEEFKKQAETLEHTQARHKVEARNHAYIQNSCVSALHKLRSNKISSADVFFNWREFSCKQKRRSLQLSKLLEQRVGQRSARLRQWAKLVFCKWAHYTETCSHDVLVSKLKEENNEIMKRVNEEHRMVINKAQSKYIKKSEQCTNLEKEVEKSSVQMKNLELRQKSEAKSALKDYQKLQNKFQSLQNQLSSSIQKHEVTLKAAETAKAAVALKHETIQRDLKSKVKALKQSSKSAKTAHVKECKKLNKVIYKVISAKLRQRHLRSQSFYLRKWSESVKIATFKRVQEEQTREKLEGQRQKLLGGKNKEIQSLVAEATQIKVQLQDARVSLDQANKDIDEQKIVIANMKNHEEVLEHNLRAKDENKRCEIQAVVQDQERKVLSERQQREIAESNLNRLQNKTGSLFMKQHRKNAVTRAFLSWRQAVVTKRFQQKTLADVTEQIHKVVNVSTEKCEVLNEKCAQLKKQHETDTAAAETKFQHRLKIAQIAHQSNLEALRRSLKKQHADNLAATTLGFERNIDENERAYKLELTELNYKVETLDSEKKVIEGEISSLVKVHAAEMESKEQWERDCEQKYSSKIKMLESIAKQETLAKDQNHSKQVKALNEKWKKEIQATKASLEKDLLENSLLLQQREDEIRNAELHHKKELAHAKKNHLDSVAESMHSMISEEAHTQKLKDISASHKEEIQRIRKRHDLFVLENSAAHEYELKKLESAHNIRMSDLQDEIQTERIGEKEALARVQKEADTAMQITMETHRQVLKTLRNTIEKTATDNRLEMAKQLDEEKARGANAVAGLEEQVAAMKTSMGSLASEKHMLEEALESQKIEAKQEIQRLKEAEENEEFLNKKIQSELKEISSKFEVAQTKMKLEKEEMEKQILLERKSSTERIQHSSDDYKKTIANMKNDIQLKEDMFKETREKHKVEIESLNKKMKLHLHKLSEKYLKNLNESRNEFQAKLDLLEHRIKEKNSMLKTLSLSIRSTMLKSVMLKAMAARKRLGFFKWKAIVARVEARVPKRLSLGVVSATPSGLRTANDRVSTPVAIAAANQLITGQERTSSSGRVKKRPDPLILDEVSPKRLETVDTARTSPSTSSSGSRGKVISEYNKAMAYYIRYRKMVREISSLGKETLHNNTKTTAKLLQDAKRKFLQVQKMCEKDLQANPRDLCLFLYKARALSCTSVVEDAMNDIHNAVRHGEEAVLLFRSLNEDEKEFQTLANTYIANIRVYTEEGNLGSGAMEYLHKAFNYVSRMLEIAQEPSSLQAKEISRLERRLSNLSATIRGEKTIEWINGKGNVRKVVFREISKRRGNNETGRGKTSKRGARKNNENVEHRQKTNMKPKMFTAKDARGNKPARAVKQTPMNRGHRAPLGNSVLQELQGESSFF